MHAHMPPSIGCRRLVELALLSAFLALPTGCSSTSRYVVADSIWSAWTSADHVAAQAYRDACPHAATTDEERAACRTRLDALATAVHLSTTEDSQTHALTTTSISLRHLIDSGRMLAASAVLGLWAAEEGDDPPDLDERLSCIAAALHAASLAVQELHLSLPTMLESALEAINRYGGSARLLLLGQCPGFDGASSGAQTGSAPPPTPAASSDACASHADGSVECGPEVM